MANIAYIGLGSNLGNREANITAAVGMLSKWQGVKLLRVSSLYQTKPLASLPQPDYINGVAEIETTLDARQLLSVLLDIENKLGRTRGTLDNSRTIDLDLLIYGDSVIDKPDLKVPHPRMHLRSFVLEGLCQLDKTLIHPLIGQPMAVLAQRLNGGDFLADSSRPQLITMAGAIGVGKTTLACNLCKVLDGSMICEAYDTNPFLAKVYAGKHDLALDSQLYFLMTRVEQLSKIAPGRPAIADYVFDKEHIYAKRLLDPEQCQLYSRINKAVSGHIDEPVLLLYLKDSVENCLDRIHLRARPYEQKIEPEFLKQLCDDYDDLVANWKKSPAITIDAATFDCRDMACVQKLACEIKYYLAI